jgi:N-acetylglucosamine transport system substrate-binding protein
MLRVTLTIAVLAVLGCGLFFLSDAVRPLPEIGSDRIEVEVAIFEGGYGIGWHRRMAERFNELHADRGIRVRLWGDPRTADIIKPRLLRGAPPDLILDERLPLWLLIASDKLTPFNESLAEPAPGSDRPWGDLFAPGMLDGFTSDGEVYAVPAAYGAWTGWYNAKLFREQGWEPPRTWEELLALCEKIERAGIAPWTIQGKYPYFYAWNTFISIVHRTGGLSAINRINALEPDAFSHPDAVEAARLLQDLSTRYLQRGAMAMTHTESQLHFVQGAAAMIFCGIWLENEMKDSMPPGFEMRAFTVPPVAGGKGSPRVFNGQGMEYLFVPRDARHPEVAFEFARFLVSPAAAEDMARSIGVISPLAGATPREAVSPALGSVIDIIEASDSIFNVRVYQLFPAWRTQVMGVALAALMRGEITPEEFGRRMDAGLAAAQSNPDAIVPPYVPYDPAALGERQ